MILLSFFAKPKGGYHEMVLDYFNYRTIDFMP